MPERYTRRILEHVADTRYEPRRVEELARDLSIPADELDEFKRAVSEMLEDGQMVLGTSETVALPPPGREMLGLFRLHERGFGFIVPDSPTEHGDLFVPPGSTGGAMSGDRVRAKVIYQKGRGGAADRSPYVGQIVEVIQRADRQYAGTLTRRGSKWVVEVDGRLIHHPVVIRDPHAKNAKAGDKVVIELIDYPEPGSDQWPGGVIVEVLGDAGEPEVETLAVMRAFGLAERFPEDVVQGARDASRSFSDDAIPDDREDLTDLFICTIDPPDARDFDDAISIRRLSAQEMEAHGLQSVGFELGIHIADVSNFVEPGNALDEEAYARGNSTYLPRKVIPMLPELLSNGVCSLQEGVNRFTKSCFIQYDAKGNVLGARFARGVIRSAKRLTYLEAQALIDGDLREARKHGRTDTPYPRELIPTLGLMDELAKVIRKRRLKEGMIVLGLPAVELKFDDSGRVIDAHPEDDSFTHTIIEMFMVEANEAAARLFDRLDVPMIRRVHPDPDVHDVGELRRFARVAGFNIPAKPSRKELQALLDAVRGKPAQHAVHLAVLRTLSKAEYSPMLVGHFALASEHYTHFTSPIRRYPDLVVHRGLDAYIQESENEKAKKRKSGKAIARALASRLPDEEQMREIGKHCSTTERNSEAAERQLRNYLVLELMADHLGEDFAGTVTGVTSAGIFVQLDKYLVDGFIRTADLPTGTPGRGGSKSKSGGGSGGRGERWQLNRTTGALVAQRSGKTITVGDCFTVRIAQVDLPRRQMELTIVGEPGREASSGEKKPSGEKKSSSQKKKKQSGDQQAEQQSAKKKRSRRSRGGKKPQQKSADSQRTRRRR